MPFVEWHYRNGYYVRSHFRRLPWRRADTSTPPLFALAAPSGTTITGIAPTAPDGRRRPDVDAHRSVGRPPLPIAMLLPTP